MHAEILIKDKTGGISYFFAAVNGWSMAYGTFFRQDRSGVLLMFLHLMVLKRRLCEHYCFGQCPGASEC